jgi:hypothetical protein
MKRAALGVLTAIAIVGGLPSAVSADVDFSQVVRLRQDPGPFTMRYSSFADGTGSCSYCARPFATAGGTMRVNLRTYRLVEENKTYDYYLVDATVNTLRRHGNEDWGLAGGDGHEQTSC